MFIRYIRVASLFFNTFSLPGKQGVFLMRVSESEAHRQRRIERVDVVEEGQAQLGEHPCLGGNPRAHAQPKAGLVGDVGQLHKRHAHIAYHIRRELLSLAKLVAQRDIERHVVYYIFVSA